MRVCEGGIRVVREDSYCNAFLGLFWSSDHLKWGQEYFDEWRIVQVEEVRIILRPYLLH